MIKPIITDIQQLRQPSTTASRADAVVLLTSKTPSPLTRTTASAWQPI